MAPNRAAELHQKIVDLYPRILKGDMEEALALLHPDVIDHRGGTEGDHAGREAWREKWHHMATTGDHSEFTDVSVTIEQTIASDDTSVHRYTSRGRHRATDRRYEILTMDMVRIQDDKIIEHWALNDQTSLKRQLGMDR